LIRARHGSIPPYLWANVRSNGEHQHNFCCLYLIEECKTISVMLSFEYALDVEVVTIVHGCGSLGINNDAAATGGTSQKKRHVFVAAP
jgi:hypothetical protein